MRYINELRCRTYSLMYIETILYAACNNFNISMHVDVDVSAERVLQLSWQRATFGIPCFYGSIIFALNYLIRCLTRNILYLSFIIIDATLKSIIRSFIYIYIIIYRLSISLLMPRSENKSIYYDHTFYTDLIFNC